jgi:hypothetical protein
MFIGLFRVVDLFCNKLKLLCGIGSQRPVKTGLVADVALAGVDGHFQNQAILVTIDEYLFDFLPVAAFFAFFPQFLPGPAEICGVSGLYRNIERFAVHICDHEHLSCAGILCYGRYEAVFIELRRKFQIFLKISFCAQLTDSFIE